MNVEVLKSIIPDNESDIERLNILNDNVGKPRVSVFGKYNHGKSTLLNALVGKEEFKASDKRETIINNELEGDNVIWIDTPGLDADIRGEDDKVARIGAFKLADHLLLVHQVQAGELDKYELNIINELSSNYECCNNFTLILTQIDQLNKKEVIIVETVIQQQLERIIGLAKVNVVKVSAKRYLDGLKENKSILCERSGMKDLFDIIEKISNNHDESRRDEKNRLVEKLSNEISIKKNSAMELRKELRNKHTRKLKKLKNSIEKLSITLA